MNRLFVRIFVFALMSVPGLALADQIDGDWCHEGLHVEIQGSQITTPGGNAITGTYTRHSFTYVVPDEEDNAGGTVAMQQLNDDMVQVDTSAASGDIISEAVIWRPCQVTS